MSPAVLAGAGCPACLLLQGLATDTGAPNPKSFEPPSLGDVQALFPNLEILSLLGAGGMGAVYKARQPALDRIVALKVLPGSTGGAGGFEERFNREARALARLSHPNIVAVYEFGRAGALHFFLMEFVDGTNLRHLERAGRLAPREALQIIPQICDALQYAHDEGVVHRDIKPENVLVDRKGRVKIADFGLAKILGVGPENARLTVEGQVMGTPHYMAPEQVERPLTVDHRADIYSLGVVFYELLTGDLPLGKFAPPSRKVEVDVRLDEIVLRALENDPARRYQQVSEVKQGVATVVASPQPAPARDASGAGTPDVAAKTGVRYLRWAGIPAVVERDGEREVRFQGALGVFFVLLFTASMGEQCVSWLAGRAHILGGTVYTVAVLVAIWAIRRTLDQPGEAEGSEKNRRRFGLGYWRDYLMVVMLLAAVVGSHFLVARLRARPGVATAETAPETSRVASATAPMRSQVVAPLRMAEEIEVTFDELVDFDSGRTSDYPPGRPDDPPVGDIGGNVLWAQENGFDADAGLEELQLLGVEIAPVASADWEAFGPHEIRVRLEQGVERPASLAAPKAGGLPVAYAYRTREQGMGLIRITAFDATRPGATVRLKRVVRPPAAVPIVARPDGRTGAWNALLSGGGQVGLLALRDPGVSSNAWCYPDGRLAGGFEPGTEPAPSWTMRSARVRELVFRVAGLPVPDAMPVFEFPAAYRSSLGVATSRGGVGGESRIRARAGWRETATNALVRVGVPLEPWRTVRSYEPVSKSSTRTRVGGDPSWDMEFHPLAQGQQGAQITITLGILPRDWHLRVLATRGRQAPVEGVMASSVTNVAVVTRTYTFPGVTSSEVANVQVETQPLEWVEFRGVVLTGDESAKTTGAESVSRSGMQPIGLTMDAMAAREDQGMPRRRGRLGE